MESTNAVSVAPLPIIDSPARQIFGINQRHSPTNASIPPRTYTVFEHRDHVSALATTWKAMWNGGLQSTARVVAKNARLKRYFEEFNGRNGLRGIELWIPVFPLQ